MDFAIESGSDKILNLYKKGFNIEKAWNTPEMIMARALKLYEKKVKELQPKADFYDTVTKSEDTLEMSEVAKILEEEGYGRNNLFIKLRELGILQTSKKNKNEPYQEYVNRGYFKLVEKKVGSDKYPRIITQTVVYQKGLDFIRKKLQKENTQCLV